MPKLHFRPPLVLTEKQKELARELRHGETLTLLDSHAKTFVHFQMNRKEKLICWMRHVSSDRRNWILWNNCLSLKEVMAEIVKMHVRNVEYRKNGDRCNLVNPYKPSIEQIKFI